jgi:hypothetical protein
MAPRGWFEGEVERRPDAVAFLEGVRDFAPNALGGLVAPDDTTAYPYGCLITVEVPGVPPSEAPVHTHLLQVMYEPEMLGGYWGCSHLWDDYSSDDPEALHLPGHFAPGVAAERAIEWLAVQLRRPLVRQEWDRRLRKPSVRWVLSDTGRVVAGRRRRPPKGRPMPDRSVEL